MDAIYAIFKALPALRPGHAAAIERGGSLLQLCVRMPLLDDIDDQQLERLRPDVGAGMPLSHRFQNKVSRLVGVPLAGLHVGDKQVSGQDVAVSRIRMLVHRQRSARHDVEVRYSDLCVVRWETK